MKHLLILMVLVYTSTMVYPQDFSLKGELLGFEENTQIILNPYLDNMEVDRDDETILLLNDSKFEFSRHLDKPTKFSLRVRPQDMDRVEEYEQLTFWAENLTMTLKGKKGQVFEASIQGSLIQDQYFRYISEIAILERISKQIVDSVKVLPDLKEDTKSNMRIRYHATLKEIEERRKKFIWNNPDYYCVPAQMVSELTFSPTQIDPKRLAEFYARMEPEARSNVYGRQIENFLKRNATIKAHRLEAGDYPYNFIVKNISGTDVKFASIQAKVILLDFWSYGCGPCRIEHKNYASLYEIFKKRGFEIVSVSSDQSKKRMLTAIAEDKMSWICLWDESKRVSNELYQIPWLPTNYVIVQGKVAGIDVKGEVLRKILDDTLGTD